MNEIVPVTGLSNQEFLEKYARPGCIGLSGGVSLIDRVIRRAERHVGTEKEWSQWSHALLVISPDHYAIFKQGGWDRTRIEAGIWQALKRPGRDLIEGAGGVGVGIDPSRADEMVDKFHPGGLIVVRAGGDGGLFSAIIGGWPAQRRNKEVQIVSKEIGT